MEERMRKGAILVLLIAMLLTSCATNSGTGSSAVINVTGSSDVTVEADIASFSVSAEAVRNTTDEAREATDAIITEAVTVLKDKYGVADDDIRTSYLTLSPEYSYVDNQRVLTGQRGYQSIDVNLSSIENIGAIVEDLAKINGISISSITLDRKDKSAAMAEARRLAVEDAMEKAEVYASAIGKNLGAVISITAGGSPSFKNSTLRLESAAYAASDQSYSTNFYSYDLTCSDSVSLVVEIAD